MPSDDRLKPLLRVVALGASAGGLEALQAFFENLPDLPGTAYVVIQHLSPDFKSLMDELLSRHTTLAIRRAEEGRPLEAGTIHLAPAGKEMILHEGLVSLSDREPGVVSHPIDVFFRSLAREYGQRAVAVVLSGTGTDGTRGLREVHTAGGLILVQQPESAAFDGMPRSALGTGLPHYALTPQDMGAVLAESLLRTAQARIPDGEPPQRYAGIFAMLLERFGLDFRAYKPTTVGRRIERRMAIRQSGNVDDYLGLLAADTAELDQLYRDLLIGVTQFFRDPEAFEILVRRVVPGILARAVRREVRVWIPGCATGEEVYSLAILFAEQAEAARFPGGIKLFATDVHRQALTQAGQGLYSAESLGGVSPDRLNRWFTAEDDSWRVSPDLRHLVVFAEHNLVKDPPFTRMDLIACRNLLIYLQPAVQARVLALFHFALAAQGTLFLGPSESLGDLDPEFESVDRHWRIFTKRRDVRLPRHDLFVASGGRAVSLGGTSAGLTPQQRIQRAADQLLSRFAPPAVLLDAKRRVLHAFGRAANLLRRRPGYADNDLLQLLDGGSLRVAAQSVLQRAQNSRQVAVLERIAVPGSGALREFRLTAEPFSEPGLPPYQYLLTFEDLTPAPREEAAPPPRPADGPGDGAGDGAGDGEGDGEGDGRVADLKAELAASRESLKTTVRQLEDSNEAFQATNEELQSANEELQAGNEELQSVNEELHTVNTEHERKILELDQAHADMDNLLRSTDIGTVFVDTEGLVRRLTPAASRLLGLGPDALGRPLGEVPGLEPGADPAGAAREVLDGGRPLEREVRSADGRDFLLRVTPYLDEQGRLGGAVATFVDICRVKGAETALARTATRLDEQGRLLDALVAAMGDGVILLEPSGRVALFNPAAERILGRGPDLGTPEDWPRAYGFHLADQTTPAPWEDLPGARALRGETADDQEFFVERPDMPAGVWVAAGARPLRDAAGRIIGGLAVLRDRTRRKAAELQMERARRSAEAASRAKSEFLATMSHEIRTPLNAVINLTEAVLSTGLEADQREALETVRDSGAHLLTLVNDLLDISRIEAEEHRRRVRRPREAAAPSRCHLLVVDDNPVNVRVTATFLARLGHGHEAAADGASALAALRRAADGGRPFDLVLMDLEMPGMDGREVTARIRDGEAGDLARGVPVVALTAHAGAAHRTASLAAGMDGFLTKPLDIEELHQVLEDLLGPCLLPGPAPEEAATAPDAGAEAADALLDLPGLLARCAGERALARNLLAAFLEDLPLRLTAFDRPMDSGDLPGLAAAAHSLKGSSATMGAVGLTDLSAALEERALAGDHAESRRILRDLREVARRTLDGVRRTLDQGRLSADPDGDSPAD